MRSKDGRLACRPFNRCMWQGLATFVAAALLAPGALADMEFVEELASHGRDLGARVVGISHGQKFSGTKVEYSVEAINRLSDPFNKQVLLVGMEIRQNIPIEEGEEVELLITGGQSMLEGEDEPERELLMQEMKQLVTLQEDLANDPGCTTPVPQPCIDGDCYRVEGTLNPARFRFSAAAYQDESRIEIQTILTFLPIDHQVAINHCGRAYHQVDKPGAGGTQADQLFVFDHTFGIEDGDPQTDDEPPIAWNKLQMYGTKYAFKPADSTYHLHADYEFNSNQLVTDARANFTTYDPSPASGGSNFSISKDDWLQAMPNGTAVAAMVHGTPAALMPPDHTTGAVLSTLIDGANAVLKPQAGLPPYAFVCLYACDTLTGDGTGLQDIPNAFNFVESIQSGRWFAGFKTSISHVAVFDGMDGEGLAPDNGQGNPLAHHWKDLFFYLKDGDPVGTAVEESNEHWTPTEAPVAFKWKLVNGQWIIYNYDPAPMQVYG
ncbi:MAG: hypothetical protein ACOCX1_01110, partial [Fimbriimonadaceae bacterium]